MFWKILGGGLALLILQAFFAWQDGYLTHKQLQATGITGWALMEHGGFLADFLVVLTVAYLAQRHQFAYGAPPSFVLLALVCTIVILSAWMYQKAGETMPEAYTHGGYTTPAGIIHVLFAIAGLWFMGLLYLGPARPMVSTGEFLLLIVPLSLFFFAGVAKVSPDWEFTAAARWQVGIECGLLWSVTAVRIGIRWMDNTGITGQ